ncbi:sugar-binding protein, partial [Chryseobacterium formosus]|nr:sugar-binding protein [Chryseobacterium formosus]
YDSKGNLLQYTTKDGITTSIIWGYNGTQPIAKIVGYPYSIVSPLASSIISASDQDALNPANEANLLLQLDAFRKNSGLEEGQITTYTYDPLIGVTSITPPSGIREVYLYDTANRLKEIRENNASGKILKEFKYNYKQ